MNTLVAFLRIVLPQVPQLAAMFRAAFVQVGGDESTFDQILDANQKDIDLLANPDHFRHKPKE